MTNLLRKELVVSLLLLFMVTTMTSCQRSNTNELPRSKNPAPANTMVFAYGYGDVYAEIRTLTTDGIISKSFHCANYPKNVSDNPLFSPDRQTIAYAHNNIKLDEEGIPTDESSSIWVMDAEGNNRRQLAKNTSTYVTSWLPDGKHILYPTTNTVNYANLQGRTGEFDMSNLISYDLETTSLCVSTSGKKAVFYQSAGGREGRTSYSVIVCDIVGYIFENPRVIFTSDVPIQTDDYISGSGGIPRFCWLDDSEFLFVSYNWAPIEKQNSSGKVVVENVPYNSAIWRINAVSGAKEKLLDSEPWQIIGSLTASATRQEIAFLYWTQAHGQKDYLTSLGHWEEGKAPRPATFNLNTKEVKKISIPSNILAPSEPIVWLNWSAP